MKILQMIGRNQELFVEDLAIHRNQISKVVESSRFLVIGGAGSIGQAVVKEIFNRSPKAIHIIDIDENGLVELVRDLRSQKEYKGDFKTLCMDCGSQIFEAYIESEDPYDYVLNLSAMKHVRSEKDPYTLMRMIEVNIENTIRSVNILKKRGTKKYFCVSTDKAANPVNMMGASKRIMEMLLFKEDQSMPIAMARFANVAFSNGSLLYGMQKRYEKQQPLVAPIDVKRYFITPKEAGELCLISCIQGQHREIFYPKLNPSQNLLGFDEIATRFVRSHGKEPLICGSEEAARKSMSTLDLTKFWPCYFFKSDTTGEKDIEEFYTKIENIDENKFNSIGIIRNEEVKAHARLEYFIAEINQIKKNRLYQKKLILELFKKTLPNFLHEEKNKSLDSKM